MAILSVSDFLASREAIEAGVADTPNEDAERAIRRAEAKMNLTLGYKVNNEEPSISFQSASGDTMLLPERVRTISAITETPVGGSASAVASYDIRGNGFNLYRIGGWRSDYLISITGTFGYATDEDRYELAVEFVTLCAARYLASTSPLSGLPVTGGQLTGYSSENASFQWWHPSDTTTGYQDLDLLLDQIGRHPSKGKNSLYTIGLTRGTQDITFDDILAGRETPDDL